MSGKICRNSISSDERPNTVLPACTMFREAPLALRVSLADNILVVSLRKCYCFLKIDYAFGLCMLV